jgi:hypothetical protein
MEKPQLLKKLESILDEAERTRMFGTIEIEIRDGRTVVMRTTKTDRLDTPGENHRAQRNEY